MTLAQARAIVVRHRVIAGLALLLALPVVFIVTHFLPRTYAATASLLLSNQRSDASNELTTVLTSLAKSSAILERVRVATNDAVPVAILQQNVKARLYGTILKITYTDSRPTLAVAVPNAVVDSLVSYYNNLASTQYQSSTARLQVELERKKRQLHDLDRRMQAMSAAGIPVDAENPAGHAELSSTLASLESQRIAAQDTLRSDEAYAATQPAVATGPGDVSTNSEYATLEGALQRDETQLRAAKLHYTEDYPGLADFETRVASDRSQLAALRTHLIAAGAAVDRSTGAANRTSPLVAADHAKVDALDGQINALQLRSERLTGSRVTVETVKAERDSVVSQFAALSSSLATALASRAIAENYGTLSVIDRATYAEVAGINAKIVALIDVLIALAIAFGIAVLADRRRERPVAAATVEPNDTRRVLTTPSQRR